MRIQKFINQNREDSITIYKHMKHLVAEKKSNEFQMLNRAVEIDAQTEKMKEMNQELCLDMEGFRQFRDINNCILIFNCMYARFIFFKIMNIF